MFGKYRDEKSWFEEMNRIKVNNIKVRSGQYCVSFLDRLSLSLCFFLFLQVVSLNMTWQLT